MSAARPITIAIKTLETQAHSLRANHTIDDKWPANKMTERVEYMRLMSVARNAKAEFNDLRQKELRLSRYESQESAA